MPAHILRSKIITLDHTASAMEAVLCWNGRIEAVGSTEDLLARSPKAEVLDLRDGVLTPGLTDAHLHLVMYGFKLGRVNLEDTASWREAVQRVRAASEEQAAGEWVQGWGFHRSNWGLETHPLAAWLDEVTPHHPVCLRSRDGHSTWLNSLALTLAGIHADTPDPEGGVIVRDDHGKPTGTLLERANALVDRVIPEPSMDETLAAARRGALDMRERGFTCVHTMAAEPVTFLRAMQELEARQELPLRIWACIDHAHLEQVQASGLRGGTGDRVRLGGIKFFADGALGSRTALMLEDYRGFPGERGVRVDSKEAFLERGRWALELGFAPVVHAIGDQANRDMLDVLEALAPLANSRGVRLRLEHAQHLSPDDIVRFGRLGVVASMQPIHLPGDTANINATLGPDRASTSFAFRSLIASGATLALGSDAPIATPDPVLGFQAAVERLDPHGQPWQPQEALTRLETLTGYTVSAATAAGWGAWYGRIQPGFAAEFTLWDRDPTLEPATPIRAVTPGFSV